jgi:hypothetical protein
MLEVLPQPGAGVVAGFRLRHEGDIEYGLGIYLVPDSYTDAQGNTRTPSDAGSLRISFGPVLESRPPKSLPLTVEETCQFAQDLARVLDAYEKKHVGAGTTQQMVDTLIKMKG